MVIKQKGNGAKKSEELNQKGNNLRLVCGIGRVKQLASSKY